jgi:hypothetical protein
MTKLNTTDWSEVFEQTDNDQKNLNRAWFSLSQHHSNAMRVAEKRGNKLSGKIFWISTEKSGC